jgi:nucleoside phosphorylase
VADDTRTTSESLALVAAFGPELAPFLESGRVAAAGAASRPGVLGCTVGIGLAAAAAGTARVVADLRPCAVVFVGTCGAYHGAGLTLGDVVVSRRVRLADAAVAAGQAALPAPMTASFDAHAELVESLARAGARAGGSPAREHRVRGRAPRGVRSGRRVRRRGSPLRRRARGSQRRRVARA